MSHETMPRPLEVAPGAPANRIARSALAPVALALTRRLGGLRAGHLRRAAPRARQRRVPGVVPDRPARRSAAADRARDQLRPHHLRRRRRVLELDVRAEGHGDGHALRRGGRAAPPLLLDVDGRGPRLLERRLVHLDVVRRQPHHDPRDRLLRRSHEPDARLRRGEARERRFVGAAGRDLGRRRPDLRRADLHGGRRTLAVGARERAQRAADALPRELRHADADDLSPVPRALDGRRRELDGDRRPAVARRQQLPHHRRRPERRERAHGARHRADGREPRDLARRRHDLHEDVHDRGPAHGLHRGSTAGRSWSRGPSRSTASATARRTAA